MGIEVGGIFGLLILIADIWAIVNVVRSAASTGSKVLWVLLILILPVIGLIIWLLAGPPHGKVGVIRSSVPSVGARGPCALR
jgi:hypothetical protein